MLTLLSHSPFINRQHNRHWLWVWQQWNGTIFLVFHRKIGRRQTERETGSGRHSLWVQRLRDKLNLHRRCYHLHRTTAQSFDWGRGVSAAALDPIYLILMILWWSSSSWSDLSSYLHSIIMAEKLYLSLLQISDLLFHHHHHTFWELCRVSSHYRLLFCGKWRHLFNRQLKSLFFCFLTCSLLAHLFLIRRKQKTLEFINLYSLCVLQPLEAIKIHLNCH